MSAFQNLTGSSAPIATVRVLEEDLDPCETRVSRCAAVEVLVDGMPVAQLPATAVRVIHSADRLTVTSIDIHMAETVRVPRQLAIPAAQKLREDLRAAAERDLDDTPDPTGGI